MFNEDEEKIEEDDDMYSIEERLILTFSEVKSTMPHIEVVHLRESVMNIVKRKSKNNSRELNENILELINMDDNFRKQIVAAK